MTAYSTDSDETPAMVKTQRIPDAFLRTAGAADEGNNFPGVPIDREKLGIDEFLVDRLTHKPPEKYKFRRSIARGGMKMVLQVRDMDTMRDVAMAVLPDAESRPPTDILRFVQEARLTASLEHPNIVPVHDIGIDSNGAPYFTMKLLRGQTLAALLTRLSEGDADALAEFPLHRRLRLFLKICSGVAFAHSKSVLHLDLKPENIQIGDFGEVLIMDWGLARVKDEAEEIAGRDPETPPPPSDPANVFVTLEGVMKGTPGYMAPEQAAGLNSRKDERTDIYALGAILYALITLKDPIEKKAIKEMVNDTITGAIIPPRVRAPEREIPAALEAVVRKAMSLAPEERYSTVTELRDEVNAFIAGYATVAENATPFKKIILLAKRHSILTSALAVILFFLVAGGGYLSHERARKKAAWIPVFELSSTAKNSISAAADNAVIRSADLAKTLSPWTAGTNGLDARNGEWLWLDPALDEDWSLDLEFIAVNPGETLDVSLGGDPSAADSEDHLPSGYLFRFGADNGKRNLMLRKESGLPPMKIAGLPAMTSIPGKPLHAVFRREGGTLTISNGKNSVNEAYTLEFLPPSSKQKRQIGFFIRNDGIVLTSIRLTVRQMAEQPTPLVAASALMEEGLPEAAIRKYLHIADSFPGTFFSDRALLEAYRIAILYRKGLSAKDFWIAAIKKRIALKKSFQFENQIREIDAAGFWLEGKFEAALQTAGTVLAHDSKSGIVPALLNLPRKELSASAADQLFALAQKTKDLRILDLSGLGLTNLKGLRGLKLQYLDCSKNNLVSFDGIDTMPLRTLVTDSGIHCGSDEIRAVMNSR